MSISYVNKNDVDGKAVALTGVTSGNLIVCMLQWADSDVTPTLSDGTNAPIGYGAVVKNGTAQFIRFAYWLSSPKSGTVTYTWTATGGGGHTSHVFEISCATTWELEHIDAGATGTSATAVSGNETATNTSMVAFGGGGWWVGASYVSATIDGAAVDQYAHQWEIAYGTTGVLTMRVLNNPGTYNSSIVVGSSALFVADLIAFREAAVTATLEQEGFLFRNDDGSETTATGKANQDTNINLAADTAFRLRFLLKATGNPDSIDAQAEARVKPSGGAFGAWGKIN